MGAFRRGDNDKRKAAIATLVAAISTQLAQLENGDESSQAAHTKRLHTAVHLLTLVLVTDPEAREAGAYTCSR